jgi:hypothetical protein
VDNQRNYWKNDLSFLFKTFKDVIKNRVQSVADDFNAIYMRSKIAQSTHNPTPPMNIICSSCGKSYVPFSLNSNLSHAEQTTI